MTIFAVNLVALGVVFLACSGIFFSPPRQPVSFARMRYETAERFVICPMVGALALAIGIAVFIVSPKRDA